MPLPVQDDESVRVCGGRARHSTSLQSRSCLGRRRRSSGALRPGRACSVPSGAGGDGAAPFAGLAVVALAVGSFVGAGASDDRFVGGVADVHAGAVAGGGDDLPVGEAEDEGALLVAAVELGADAGVASERLSAFEELAGDVAEVACGGAGGFGAVRAWGRRRGGRTSSSMSGRALLPAGLARPRWWWLLRLRRRRGRIREGRGASCWLLSVPS